MKEYLISLPLFDGCNFDELDEKYGITKNCKVRHYRENEVIVSSESKEFLPLIIAGCAEIRSGISEKSAFLRYIYDGDLFGAASLFMSDENCFYKTVVTASVDTDVLLIPKETVDALILGCGIFAKNYIKFLSDRIAFLNRKITAFTQGSAEAKLAVFLISLKKDRFTVPFSLSELPAMLGIARASLYRAFDFLSENGIIKKNGKEIIILDRNKLDKIIG